MNVGYAEYFGLNRHCARPDPSAAISFTFDVSCDCSSDNFFRETKKVCCDYHRISFFNGDENRWRALRENSRGSRQSINTPPVEDAFESNAMLAGSLISSFFVDTI